MRRLVIPPVSRWLTYNTQIGNHVYGNGIHSRKTFKKLYRYYCINKGLHGKLLYSHFFHQLLWAKQLQSCVYKSDLRSTNTLRLVSTIPRIKRIQVKLFPSNYITFVYTTFLWAVAMLVVIAIKSLILCLRDCASYPSLGLHNLAVQLSSRYFPVHSTWGSSNAEFFLSEKGVVLGSGVSGHP